MMLAEVNSVFELYQLLQEKKSCLFQFLQDESLLHSSANCPKCGRRMTLQNFEKFKFHLTWRCSTRKCRTRISAAYDSFFQRSYIDVDVIMICMYLWCAGVSPKVVTDITGISNTTVLQVFEYVRDICSWQLLQAPEEFQFGGPDKIVEIFQTTYSEKKNDEANWILAIYCREDKRGALQMLKNRDAETVIPIIKEYVLPGSTIYSDLSPAYKTLTLHGYEHQTVASLKRSNNPQSGATITNQVKGWWSACKKKLTVWNAHTSINVDRHLDVLMWRDIYGRDDVKETFKNILNHIRSRYQT